MKTPQAEAAEQAVLAAAMFRHHCPRCNSDLACDCDELLQTACNCLLAVRFVDRVQAEALKDESVP